MMKGFGVGPDIAVQSQTVQPKPNVLDSINNILTKVVQPAANVYSQVTTKPGTTPTVPGAYPTSVPVQYGQSMQPAPQPADNTKKYLLIGGAVVLVGGTVYLLTRKKK